jgi:predicted TIM-barrel fold metal-dependent hydrolase
VVSGVFDRYPDLKIVLAEGGFGWLPTLMWRFDAQLQRLGDEVNALQRTPSEYIREHFWFTTQPIEEPERPRDLLKLLEHLQMDGRALFATDYPHWDFDAPDSTLPTAVPEELKAKIFGGNALDLYGGIQLGA